VRYNPLETRKGPFCGPLRLSETIRNSIAEAGAESNDVTPCDNKALRRSPKRGGAKSGAVDLGRDSWDDLAYLKARWPALPDHVIHGILAMIQAAQDSCD
jgi:hypothetical protein